MTTPGKSEHEFSVDFQCRHSAEELPDDRTLHDRQESWREFADHCFDHDPLPWHAPS